MKYISIVVLLVLMSWTWSLATAQDSFTLEQYKNVEAGVENDIRGFIIHKYPDTKEIVCSQLYTEAVTAGVEMIAHFRCQAATALDSPDASAQTFEGQLRLKSTDGFKTWSETGGEIINPDVTFLNGTQIKASHDGTGANEPGDEMKAEPKTAPAHPVKAEPKTQPKKGNE